MAYSIFTSMTVHLIHDAFLAVGLSNTFFVRWADARRASHAGQLVADDDECDIYMSDYVDTCRENLVTLFDIFYTVDENEQWREKQRKNIEKEKKLV